MKFSEAAKGILKTYESGGITSDIAIGLLTACVKDVIGDNETTLQGFPSQWKGTDADRMKKLWVNARNHLRRQILKNL